VEVFQVWSKSNFDARPVELVGVCGAGWDIPAATTCRPALRACWVVVPGVQYDRGDGCAALPSTEKSTRIVTPVAMAIAHRPWCILTSRPAGIV
jgi:hypothetical protein